jgi:hypothetical protein
MNYEWQAKVQTNRDETFDNPALLNNINKRKKQSILR